MTIRTDIDRGIATARDEGREPMILRMNPGAVSALVAGLDLNRRDELDEAVRAYKSIPILVDNDIRGWELDCAGGR